MSPTKTEEQFQTTAHKPQHAADLIETRGMRVLRDRSIVYKGLCSNCEKLESCTYPSTTSDTWFCEEYSYAKPEKATAISTEEEQQLPETVTGLCMNCELRDTCKFPKPAGGVWFCGEYQ
ncbi:MAG: hypothetical protein ACXVZV_02755 [Terriglobales bacterium]